MHLFKWLIIIHSLISTSLSVLVNVTVDDTHGNVATGTFITYHPADQWSSSSTCDSCAAHNDLNRTMILDGTWHEGIINNKTTPLLATIPFSGSAIYVYCIIPTIETPFNVHMDITFLIDSQLAGTFSRKLTRNGTFQYKALVYANQSLPQGSHMLTIQNGRIGGVTSLMLLDYIVYSYDTDLLGAFSNRNTSVQPTSPPSVIAESGSPIPNVQPPKVNSAGKIVGGVLGSMGGISLVLMAFLWRRQRIWKGPNNFSCSQTPSPKLTSIISVTKIQSWWRNINNSRRRFSFNPSLLVEPMMMNQKHTVSPNIRRPPPVTTVHPIHPLPQRPDSTNPLHPNREVTPAPSLDPRNEQSQPLSIAEWQRRTQREADDVPPRLDVSDVEMSSYYEFSSDDAPPPQPRPRSAPRRFTVVNA